MSLSESGTCLQFDGLLVTECQYPAIKTCSIGWIGGIKIGDTGILESYLGRGDRVFGEDGCCQ